MTDQEMEDGLRKLGRATEPRGSMVSAVMERVEKIDGAGPLSIDVARGGRRAVYRAAAVLLAAAACIGALVFVLRSGQEAKPRPQIVVNPETHSADQPADAIPRLIDYQRAYAQSADALEALLQQRPSGEGAGDEPVIRVGDVVRKDFDLYP